MADRRSTALQPAGIKTGENPIAPVSVAPKRRGKTPLTPEQKEARKQQLLNEPKDAKFRRLANYRMPKALKAIASIGLLANRQSYSYTSEQVIKILEALRKAVVTVDNKFSGNKENGATFAL